MDYSGIFKFLSGRWGSCYSSVDYYSHIGEWLDWYKGYLKSFHIAKVSNGLTTPNREIRALRMAKRVCEDWASSVLCEDVKFVITSSNKKSSIFVQGSKGQGGVLGSNNFGVVLSQSLEQMFALGTCAFVLGLNNIGVDSEGNIVDAKEGTITLDSVNATRIIPISYKNGVVSEAAFITVIVYKNETYYVVSSHVKEDDGYVIYNDLLDKTYNSTSLNIGLLPVIRTKSSSPLFYIIKTNIANNLDLDCPLGVSIYGNALDNIKGCDIIYDACIREVETGQRIVMMNKCLLTTDDKGYPIAPQDNKQTYMQFFGDDALAGTGEFIKEFHPSLNNSVLDAELQSQLNMLSTKVGLGTNYYKFDSSGVVTATEYVGQRNDFMRNSVKISKSISLALHDLVLGILYLGKNVLGQSVDDNAKVEVFVADGVVEDDGKLMDRDLTLVREGIMSKAEFRSKWFGESIDEASRNISSITGVVTAESVQKDF